MTDSELLRQYRETGAEEAFAALVSRHAGLVYSAARRQVRSPHLAEEIAQSVFTDLARQAARLKPDTHLGAWLYCVTRRTALDCLRRESRRRKREQIAWEMAAMNSTPPDWTQIEPLLEEAMEQLNAAERSAILIRYFENKTLRDVGQVLGISDDAAQKRVRRAVERLRAFFTQRGVTVSSGSLALLISAHAVAAAPAGLAANLTAASISATSAGAAGSAFLCKLMLMTKTKTALISAIVVAALGPALLLRHQQRLTREENARLLQRESELMAANASLGDELNRFASRAEALEQTNMLLRAQVANLQIQRRAPDAQIQTAPRQASFVAEPEPDSGLIRLRKENLDRLQYDALTENFELTEVSKDLLQLTLDELARITAALQGLKERVQAHDLAGVRQVPAEEVKDEDIVRFLHRIPGQATTFRIPPFTPQEQQALKDSFGQHLQEILGAERSTLLFKNARPSLDFWLGGNEGKIVAFIDRLDSDNSPVSDWMVKFSTPSSRGTYSGGSNRDPVPPQFKYLFEIHQPPD